MNTTLKLRLGGFVLAIGILASLIAWAAITLVATARRIAGEGANGHVGEFQHHAALSKGAHGPE
jgi:hypothetical protein